MKRSPWQNITQALGLSRSRDGHLVQARDTGRFKDLHEFPRRRQAKAYIRTLVRDWAEDPREFRIVKVRRQRR